MADREGPIQAAIVAYLRAVLPADNIVAHVRNEVATRGGNAARQIATAKRRGLVPGFPDLLVIRHHPLPLACFEVKAEGNYATPAQREIHDRLRALGCQVAVVRSVDDVRDCLREWHIPTSEVEA